MKRLIELMILVPAASFALPVLVDSALKGAVLMAAILLAVLLLRRSSAAVRHLVLVAAMGVPLMLPLLSLTLPGWRVLPSWAQTRVAPTPLTIAGSQMAVASASDFGAAGSVGAMPLPVPADAGLTPVDKALSLDGNWVTLAVCIWLLGSALLGLRLALGQWALWRLGCKAHRADDGDRVLASTASELRAALRIRWNVKLLMHPARSMPMTWGIFKSRLLLPAAARDWDAGRLRAVLLHELAHVKRRDCLTQFLVQLTCAIHWFNPLVWIAARKIATEREHACDDLVLNSGIRASDYAEHLLRIATGYESNPVTGVVALAMAKSSRLEGRLTSILSDRTDRRSITLRVALGIACALALVAFPVAMLRAVGEDDAEVADGNAHDPTEKSERAKSGEFDGLILALYNESDIPSDVRFPAAAVPDTATLKPALGSHSVQFSPGARITIPQITKPWLSDPEDAESAETPDARGLGEAHPEIKRASAEIRALERGIIETGQKKIEASSFAGIGVTLNQAPDSGVTVGSLLAGGPAEKSEQLKVGDRIIAVAEGKGGKMIELLDGMDMAAIVGLIRGKAGDLVRLRIQRDGDGDGEWQQMEVSLVRGLLKLDSPGKNPAPKAIEKPILLPLKRADAQAAKKAIDGVIGQSHRGRVIADVRSNSLIYLGDAKTLELVRSMLEWLDQP